jgi:hypothetical protein
MRRQSDAVGDHITLVDIEAQIAHHQRAIAELREVGIRLDEAAAMPGAKARKWLVSRGATGREATALIVKVVRERRVTRTPGGDS